MGPTKGLVFPSLGFTTEREKVLSSQMETDGEDQGKSESLKIHPIRKTVRSQVSRDPKSRRVGPRRPFTDCLDTKSFLPPSKMGFRRNESEL